MSHMLDKMMDRKSTQIMRIILLIVTLSSHLFIQQQFSNNNINSAYAQDVKGLAKPSGVTSSFKQNILSLQQKRLNPIQVGNVQSYSSSSSTLQQQLPVVNSVSRTSVVEQQDSFSNQVDSEPAVYGSVDGVPGVDFPGFTSIPNTGFTCEGKPFDPGMYADESTGCQVYHLCYQGRRESFLCGIGTVFNQAILNCDFWHSVECARSREYYHLNSEFGKASSEPNSFNIQQQQQVSSNFVSAPAAVSNLVSKIQNQLVQQQTSIVQPKPIGTFKQQQIETSSVLANGFARPTSNLLVTGALGVQGNGKTSQRRDERIFSAAKGFLSPGQQLQLNRGLQQPLIGDAALEYAQQAGSETSRTVISKTDSAPVSSAASSLSVAQTNRFEQQQDQQQSGYGTKSSRFNSGNKFINPTKEKLPLLPQSIQVVQQPTIGKESNEIQPAVDGGEWKVYFKKKPSPASPAARRPTAADSSSSSSTTLPASSSGTTNGPLSTEVSPNQDPSFSNNNNSNSEATAEELPKPPKSSPPPSVVANEAAAGSVESDVSDALTTTLPASTSSQPPTTTSLMTAGDTATTTSSNDQTVGERTSSTEEPTQTTRQTDVVEQQQPTTTTTAAITTTTTTEAPPSTTTTAKEAATSTGSSVTYEKETSEGSARS